jgi:hypothetical protein
MKPTSQAGIVALVVVSLHVKAAVAQCTNKWAAHFGLPGLTGVVDCCKVFDDGSGPALYVARNPIGANGVALNGVAKWDGITWSSLSPFGVNEFEIFDDGLGSGPALYAAGRVPEGPDCVAKWNGTEWIVLAQTSFNGTVTDLAVFDDGNGACLYTAGQFTRGGGISTRYIAKWNGQIWSSLGEGLTNGTDDVVLDLQVHDDGTGTALYVCGTFTSAGGIAASRIAKWTGSSWMNVGNVGGGGVNHMTSYYDGSQTSLFIAGDFSGVDGVPAAKMAKRTGAVWSSAGTLDNVFKLGGHVYPDHSELLAATANGLYRWNGTSWQLKVATDDVVETFATLDDGLSPNPALFIGGRFRLVGQLHANHIARWNEVSWSNLTHGHGVAEQINCLTAGPVGQQPSALYAGGVLEVAGTQVDVCNIAKWDGKRWSRLKGGVNGTVWTAKVFELNPGQSHLYVGGEFQQADGLPAPGIARWDGENWSTLGGGILGAPLTMCAFNDGTGMALYVSGQFSQAGQTPVSNVAKWNGTTWSALGAGATGAVWASAVFDDGTGPKLYISSTSGQIGGIPAQIAKWNGTTWSAIGVNVIGGVRAMEVFDDGTGAALYVAGFPDSFAQFDGAVAKWNGVSWSSVGLDMIGGTTPRVHALSVVDVGSGPALFAAGKFTSIGGVNAVRVAKWNGTQWSNLDNGVYGFFNSPFAISIVGFHDLPIAQAALYVGGVDLVFASGKLSNNIARWGCLYQIPSPDCDSDGTTDHVAITSGTANDCNGNTVPDSCDISDGTSLDLNVNAVPDECEPPPIQASTNNSCGTAALIGSGYTLFNTVGATTDGPVEPHSCVVLGYTHVENDVWFRYIAPCAGVARLSLCGTAYDAKMAVYLECPTAPDQLIACSDDFCGSSPRVSFENRIPNTLYRIRIGGQFGATGLGVLHANCLACPADIDGNSIVNVSDLLAVIGSWGPCPMNAALCPADVNGDLFVNVGDLLAVIQAWGACP